MAHYSGTVIESQVDWLTVSAHGKDAARNMLDLALGLAKEEQAQGNRERRWRLMGYEGAHVGRVEYGQRDSNSTILRLIGDPADRYLDVALSVADAVTRVDLATTWRAEPPDPMIGRNAYAMAEMFYQGNTRRARPSFTGDAAGGYTCYVGARESENFLRVYNKGAECIATGDDAGAERYRACWRYELEVKGGLAKNLAEVVAGQEERAPYVRTYLYNYCQAHGIEPPFPPDGGWGLLPGFRRRSDEESKLRHLAKNVRPTVDWLREQGQLEKVLDVLGLA